MLWFFHQRHTLFQASPSPHSSGLLKNGGFQENTPADIFTEKEG